MSWKLPSSRPERLYKEPLLTPAFPAALSEIIKPLGPGVSPTPQTRGSPFTADNGHKNQISILHLHNWAAYEKSKEITAQHCSSSSRWQTLWESQHSSPQHFACDAALVHSALSDWANYPGGPPARLGSARRLTVVWQLLRPKNHSVQVTSRRLIPRTVPAFTGSGLLTNHQQQMSTWKSEDLETFPLISASPSHVFVGHLGIKDGTEGSFLHYNKQTDVSIDFNIIPYCLLIEWHYEDIYASEARLPFSTNVNIEELRRCSWCTHIFKRHLSIFFPREFVLIWIEGLQTEDVVHCAHCKAHRDDVTVIVGCINNIYLTVRP